MSDQSVYWETEFPFSDFVANEDILPVSESSALGVSSTSVSQQEVSDELDSPTRNSPISGQWFTGSLDGSGGRIIYNSYAGVDIVAQLVLPNDEPVSLGELQTISYSVHRNNMPVRVLGHTSPVGFVKGSRTIAGSMIFTVFNGYAFYRLLNFQRAIANGLYPVADMLPPFDIVLTFANESGVFSKMKLYGITIVDEGGTMSVDDLISEQTFSYMARGIQPITGFYLPPGIRLGDD